jgi:hypothetical protein
MRQQKTALVKNSTSKNSRTKKWGASAPHFFGPYSVDRWHIDVLAKVDRNSLRKDLHHQTRGKKRGGMVPATAQVIPPAGLHVPV